MTKYRVQKKKTKKSPWRNINHYYSITGTKKILAKDTNKAKAILIKKGFQLANTMERERSFYKIRIIKIIKQKSKRRK